MSEIKPWDEMLDSQIADGQVVTTMDIRESMQVEISKLRAALADRDAKLAALQEQFDLAVATIESRDRNIETVVAENIMLTAKLAALAFDNYDAEDDLK